MLPLLFYLTEGSLGVTLHNVMAFATGSEEIPILGFDRPPALKFSRGSILPTASTCGPTLYLPSQLTSAEEFSKNMCLGITCSFGFGQV